MMSNYQGWSVLVVENASGPSIESTKKNLDGFIISYGPINMCMAGWGGITCNSNFISHRLAKCSMLGRLGLRSSSSSFSIRSRVIMGGS
jgi:hypothetical protein